MIQKIKHVRISCPDGMLFSSETKVIEVDSGVNLMSLSRVQIDMPIDGVAQAKLTVPLVLIDQLLAEAKF